MKALFLLLLAFPASAGTSRPKPSREVVHPQARFKLTVPGGWSQALLGPDDLGPGAAGAVFKASPTARVEEEASLTVIYYAAGNPHFKDAADYLARQTEPLPVTPVGEETGPVTDSRLGSLPARTLTRWRPVGRPEAAVRAHVRLHAQLTVASGVTGFYVVTCAAPAPRWKQVGPSFDAALKSFMALPPPLRSD